MNIPKEHIEQSRFDAIEDCDELLWLIDGYRKKLVRFQKILQREKTFFPIRIREEHLSLATQLDESLCKGTSELSEVKKKLLVQKISTDLLCFASEKKQDWGMYLRSVQGIIGSLMVSLDWQSPSYAASITPQAGSQRGKIEATINDYKRDHHLDAYPYEQAFVREYIDAAFKPFIRLYATSSGMAAFTTALNFLIMEKKITRPVMMGANVYFENKELLAKSFDSSLYEVDEFDTQDIIDKITKYSPSVLFFDTIANTENLAMPNIEAIIEHLRKNIKSDTYIVIDNTSAGIFFQPLKKYIRNPRHLHFIIIESLNKFHQFGCDRVTGGVVWAYGKDSNKLFSYREHLGTNIPDASIHTLPMPNRVRLAARMLRLGRNALLIARGLQDFVGVAYPGLGTHQSYAWSKNTKFHGAFLVPQFAGKKKSVSAYQKFISSSIKISRNEGVGLIAGTSFGFSTTRIYLTALRASTTTPFLRISAGTEQLWEVERLIKVFRKAI